ncbi:MAG TPA: cysteine hydrolase [Chloroflexota bacterium]|nr:cysteine hydrolase [Chloroflexota bacterium]
MQRWAGLEILETLDELVRPEHTVLLLWDFASGVVGNCFNKDTLIPRTAQLVAAARAHGVPVLWARQNDMYLMGDTGAAMIRMRMKQWKVADLANFRPGGVRGTPEWEFLPELRPQEGDVEFEKFLPNAFLGTNFEWRLRKLGAKTIILTGINVATGIPGTAREAIHRGYYAVVARDCVGGRERDYARSLPLMETLLDVFDSSEIIAAWERRGV